MLFRSVRGELDWIVMKCLEKDRNRRYETANGLAIDLQRYLADEPVVACPPSATYRLKKFARRNKAALAATGGCVIALTMIGATIGWAIRDRAARAAETERAQAARLTTLAAQVRDNFNIARALVAENNLTSARQKLAEARAQLGRDRSTLHDLAAEVDAGAAELDRFEQFKHLIDQAYQAEHLLTHYLRYFGYDPEKARDFANDFSRKVEAGNYKLSRSEERRVGKECRL